MPTVKKIRYAGFPTALVFGERAASPGKTTGTKPVQQLLWGDWLEVKSEGPDGWLEVSARGEDGWMHASTVQADRLLEITFVDIGQGDGCILSTPDDRHVIVDAGQDDNLYRFLKWRFGRFKKSVTFDAAILTHSDQDHYGGLRPFVDDPNVRIRTLYHNGLVERATPVAADVLGPRVVDGGQRYVTEPIETLAQLRALLSNPAQRAGKKYPNLLWDAMESGRVDDVRSLSVRDAHVPGYAPGHASGVELHVLGPVPDDVGGRPAMKWFGDVGKTKNGHSVVVKAVYKDVTILLGGDLNIPAERHLLAHHTRMDPEPADGDEEERFLRAARGTFECDIAKSCHHGSADFDDRFMRALNPLATIISSGDAEPHSHPRADTLGATGRNSRGRRPLILSTELARSAPERIKHPFQLRRELAAAAADASPEGKAKLDRLLAGLERSVAIYGAINLRTDGDRVVLAQRIESGSPAKKWDAYALERDAGGSLYYQSKHDAD